MKRANRMSVTTKYVLLVSALMLLTNIVLSSVMIHQFRSTIQTLVRRDMLDISNTAAGLLDGDVLGELKEEDVGTPKLEDIRHQLAVFQDNVDIEYIYAVRQVGEDDFVFTVDADPKDPADFGEEVLVTYALRQAAKGTAAVDTEPARDEWGNFYSAYSPVFDSNGDIACIIGVDYDADWFDRKILENSVSVGIISALSVILTLAVLLIVTGNIRRKFAELNADLSTLATDVEELASDLVSDTGYRKPEKSGPEDEADMYTDLSAADIEALSGRIRSMHTDIKAYIDHVHEKARTDALTGVGNTTAYMERTEKLDAAIAEGKASFRVAVFDINFLKHLNDEYGHMCGDRVIRGAAALIAGVFGADNTYRIGGDEFIAIAEGATDEEMASRLAVLDEAAAKYNEANRDLDGILSISKGLAAYRPGEDMNFKSVFSRADKDMYESKVRFHREHSEYDRRR